MRLHFQSCIRLPRFMIMMNSGAVPSDIVSRRWQISAKNAAHRLAVSETKLKTKTFTTEVAEERPEGTEASSQRPTVGNERSARSKFETDAFGMPIVLVSQNHFINKTERPIGLPTAG